MDIKPVTPQGPKVNTTVLALIGVTEGYLRAVFLRLPEVGAENQPGL